MGRLATFVSRHHEPVGTTEFRLLAVAIAITAAAVVCLSTYTHLVADQVDYFYSCPTGACDSVEAPSLRSPLQEPVYRDLVPARPDAERHSWRRG